MVWYDGPFKLKTCPVRSLTPTVEGVLKKFDRTHKLVTVPMTVVSYYERAEWCAPGSADEQDAWLTRALEIVCETMNATLREGRKRARPAKKKEKD